MKATKIAEAIRKELDWREIPERADMRRYISEIAAKAAVAAMGGAEMDDELLEFAEWLKEAGYLAEPYSDDDLISNAPAALVERYRATE